MLNVIEATSIVNRKIEHFPRIATVVGRAVRVSAPKGLQAKLDFIARALRQHYSDAGRKLVYHRGCWLIFENGQWRVLDKRGREDLSQAISKSCRNMGLAYGPIVKRHLPACDEFAPQGKPFARNLKLEG